MLILSRLHLNDILFLIHFKAWSPYSCKDRKTCLQRCFKEEFKVLNILTANIYGERSMPVIITTTWRPSHSLKNMFSSLCLRSLRLIWRPGLMFTSPKDTTKAKFIKYFNDKTVVINNQIITGSLLLRTHDCKHYQTLGFTSSGQSF